MKDGKILICGGTGFIGQNLVKALVDEERDIRLLVHDSFPRRIEELKNNIEIFRGSILEKETLEPALQGANSVINLVGDYTGDIYNLNIRASYSLIEACKGRDLEKILFISSATVYGEYQGRPSLESDAPAPCTEYALTKYLAENVYELYSKAHHIPVIILRLANVYGPGKQSGVVSKFINSFLENQPITIHDDGKQKRNFLYVDDAVQGIRKALDYKLPGLFDVFNIASLELTSLLDLVSIIESAGAGKAQLAFTKYDRPDIQCLWLSHQKAKTLLNYEPKIKMKEGITRTLKHMQISYEGK